MKVAIAFILARVLIAVLCGILTLRVASAAGAPGDRVTISDLPAEIALGKAKRIAVLPESMPMRLDIVLMPRRDDLATAASQVTDPKSPSYRHFLAFSEWKSRFMPSSSAVASVVRWATSGGLKVVQIWPTNQAMVVQGSVGQVSTLFSTSISRYTLGGHTFYANDAAPSVPTAIAPMVADVLGLSSFATVKPATFGETGSILQDTSEPHVSNAPFIQTSSVHASADPKAPAGRFKPNYTGPLGETDLEPSDIWSSEFYDYQALQAQGHCCNPAHNPAGSPPETSIAIIAQDYPATSDITSFAKTFNLAWNYNLNVVDGASCCEEETTLDAEWAMAMSNSLGSWADTASINVYAGDNSLGGFYDAWQEALSDNKARVASSSFGNEETDYGGNGGILKKSISDFRDLTNSMVLLGWTIIVAAGDDGGDFNCERGAVNYPASDPNAVAAGGTQIYFQYGTYGFAYRSETAWAGNACASGTSDNSGGGGGGCSDTFHAPPWQDASACPLGGRALPDMALHTGTPGDPNNANYIYYYSYGSCPGSLCTSGGTSFVAPMLAGFFAQENAYRLAIGLQGVICGPQHNAICGPVGAGGPALYNARFGPHQPFYDVTQGCTSNGMSAGHCATPGYDLATGLGSANMLQLAWSINAFLDGPPSVPPSVTLSGPVPNQWYTTPQTVSVAAAGGSLGLAGFTWRLDRDPGDPTSEPSPGQGTPFWDGPAVVGSASGQVTVPADECHTVYVRAWNNAGYSSPLASYGPVCAGQLASCQFQVLPCTPGVPGPPNYAFTCPMNVDFYNVFYNPSGIGSSVFIKYASSLTGEESPYPGSVKACVPGSSECAVDSIGTTVVCPGGKTQPPPRCTQCGSEKCCRAPDGGPGHVCVPLSTPCPPLQ